MSPAGVRSGTQCVLDGLVTVVLRALVWSLGLAAGALVLWFASNVLAPIPATAATREVQLTANATPLVAAGPPHPKPAGVVTGGSDASNSAPAAQSGDSNDDGRQPGPGTAEEASAPADSGGSESSGSGDSGGSESSGDSGDSGGESADSAGSESADSGGSESSDSGGSESSDSGDSAGEDTAASDDSASDDSASDDSASDDSASDDSASSDDSGGEEAAGSDDSGGEEAAASDDSGGEGAAEADDSGDDQPQATVSDGSNNNDGDPTNDDTTADGGSVPATSESTDAENADASTDDTAPGYDSAEADDSTGTDTATEENATVRDGSNNNDGDPTNDDTTADGGSVPAGGESSAANSTDSADTDGGNSGNDGTEAPGGPESEDDPEAAAGDDETATHDEPAATGDDDAQAAASTTDTTSTEDGEQSGGEQGDGEQGDGEQGDGEQGDGAQPATADEDAEPTDSAATDPAQDDDAPTGETNESGDDIGFRTAGGSVEYVGPTATAENATGTEGDTADESPPQTASGGNDAVGSSATAADRGLDTGRTGDDGEISPGASESDHDPSTTTLDGEPTTSGETSPADSSTDDDAARTGSTNPDRGDDANADAHPINGPPTDDPETGTGQGATTAAQDAGDDGAPAQTAEQAGLYTQDTLGDDQLTEAATGDGQPQNDASATADGTPPSTDANEPDAQDTAGTPAQTAEQAGLYTQDTLGEDDLNAAATGDAPADGVATSAEPQEPASATPQVATADDNDGAPVDQDPVTPDGRDGADDGLGPNGEPWDAKYVPVPDAGTGEPLPNGNGEVIGVNDRGYRIVEYEGGGRGTVDNSGASNDIVGIEGSSADDVGPEIQQQVSDYQNGITRPDPNDPADPNTPADSGCSGSGGVSSCTARVTGPDGQEHADQTIGGTLITGDPEPAQVDVPGVGTAQCDGGANSCSSGANGATAQSGGRDDHHNAVTLDPTSGAAEPHYSGDGRATDAEGRVVDTNDGGQVDHVDDLGPGGPVVVAGGGTGEITDSRGSTARVHGSNEDGTGGSSTLTEGAGNGATTFATDGADWNVTTPVGDRQDALAGARPTDAEVRLRGPNGEAAQVDCQDCRAQFAEGEGGNAPHGRLDAQSRDADGARARVDATGRDSEVHDATGRRYENRDEDAGRLSLVGTDADRWGGNASCVGDCWAVDRTGATVHAGTADVTDPMNPTNEDGTPRREHQMGTINHRFATGADDGGEWTAGNLWSETSSTVPEGGSVTYRPTHGGGGSFTQFFPDDVDRGGAACNFGSGGNCSGTSADGQHHVSINGPTTMDPPPGVEADQRGVRLSYDGGWSTSEVGVGSSAGNDAPDAERMPWLAVPDGAVTALDDQYTHGAERPVNAREGQVAGQADSGLPALTVNGPWFEGARDSLAMSTLRSQVGEQQSAAAVGPQFDGIERQLLDGLADGTLSPEEQRGVVDGVGAIEEQHPGVIDRWGDDRGLVDTMTAYQQAQPEYAQYLAGRSPEVTWQALGVPEGDPRRAQAPTGDDVRAAADAIVAQQRGVIDTRTRLADLADSPQSQDLARRTGEFEDQLAAAQQDGVTQAEADALNATRDRILTDSAPLDAQQRDLLAQVRDQQGDLRDLDMALATTSGMAGVDTIPDPAYAAGLALPGGTLDLVDHLQEGLPAPTDADSAEYQAALGDISRIADLQYRGALDDSRDIVSPLGAARLPSTTVPDVPGAMRLGVTVDEELGRPTGALTDDYYRRLLDPSTAQQRPTEDQEQIDYDPSSLMRLAAGAGPDPYGETYDASGVRDAADRLVLSDPGGVLAAHYATQVDQDPTGRRGAAGTWFDQSWLKPDDWDAWTAQLDEQGRDGLADVQDRANKPFWDAVAGRIADIQNRVNGIDPAEARVNPGAHEAVAQGLVAFPKLAESLWTEVGYVPSGLGAPDWMLTEETVRAREEGLPASEVRPFTDGMIHMVQGTSGRVSGLVSGDWDAASRGYVGDQLDADGNVVVDLVSGRPVQANPWMTAMEDLGTASLVTGPVGGAMGRGAAGLSTRAGAFAEEASALRAGLRDTPDADVVLDGRTYSSGDARTRADALSEMARRYDGYAAGMSRDARIVNGVTQAGAAPILLWTRGGRVLADAAGRGVQAGGDALIRADDQRATVAEAGVQPRSAAALDRAGRGLGRAGQTLRDIGEGGLLQPLRWRDQSARDRELLGVDRTTDTEGIADAHTQWQADHLRPERGPDQSAADHAWNESQARAESGEATRAAGRLVGRRTQTRAEGVPARSGDRGADTSPDASPTTPDEPLSPQAPDGPDGIPPTPGGAGGSLNGNAGGGGPGGGAHGAAADTPGGATGGRPEGDGGLTPDGASTHVPRPDGARTSGTDPPVLAPDQLTTRGARPVRELAEQLGVREQTLRDLAARDEATGIELVTDETGASHIARREVSETAPDTTPGTTPDTPAAGTAATREPTLAELAERHGLPESTVREHLDGDRFEIVADEAGVERVVPRERPDGEDTGIVRADPDLRVRAAEVRRATDAMTQRSGRELLADLHADPSPDRVVATVTAVHDRAAEAYNARYPEKKPREPVTPEMIEADLALLDGFHVQKETSGRKTQIGMTYLATRLVRARLTGRPLRGGTDLLVHSTDLAADAVRGYTEFLEAVNAHLGMRFTLGHLRFDGDGATARAAARAADITVGTVHDFGFDDVLLDAHPRTRGTGRSEVRLVDEADLIMDHEGRTPLRVSGEQGRRVAVRDVVAADDMARALAHQDHLTNGQVNRAGLDHLRRAFGLDLTLPRNAALRARLDRAVWARHTLPRGAWEVVDGELVLVDEIAGRALHGRTYQDGFQSALEYVAFHDPARLTAPRRLVGETTAEDMLGGAAEVVGMSGTLETSSRVLQERYGQRVYVAPRNKESQLTGPAEPVRHPSQDAKIQAAAGEMLDMARTGRPQLVFSSHTRQGDLVAALEVHNARVRQEALDAGLDAAEAPVLTYEVIDPFMPETGPGSVADVISRAGQPGKITIATNRVGRGTDVEVGRDAAELGGLHVIITDTVPAWMFEQLRSRAGRNGQQGSYSQHTAIDDAAYRTPDGYVLDTHAPRELTDSELGFLQAAQERLGPDAVEAAFRRGDTGTAGPALPARPSRAGAMWQAMPRGSAGIDLPQYAMARAGQRIPGLSDARWAEVQDIAAEAGAVPQTSNRADRLAELLPERRLYYDSARTVRTVTEAAAGLDRAAAAGAETGMSPAEVADTLHVAEGVLREAPGTGADLALAQLPQDELKALVDHLRGRANVDVGALDAALFQLRAAQDGVPGAGRGVLTPAAAREQALAQLAAEGTPATAGAVHEVMGALFDALHPTEQALWNRQNEIEGLLVGLDLDAPAREALYAALQQEGVGTVAGLLARGDEGLGDAGAAAVAAAHARLTEHALAALDWRREHRDGLAAQPAWGDEQVTGVAAELLADVYGGSVGEWTDEVRLPLMLRALGLPSVVDLLVRMHAVGMLPSELDGMLGRATRGELTPADLAVLVPRAAGATLRDAQAPTERPGQLLALGLIDLNLRALQGERPLQPGPGAARIDQLRAAGAPAAAVTELVDALEGSGRTLAPAALEELFLQAGADPDRVREQVDTFATENGLAWDDGMRDGVARALGDATRAQAAGGDGTPGTGTPGTGTPGTGTPGTPDEGAPATPVTPEGPAVTAGIAPTTGAGGGAGAAGPPDGDATAAPAETGTAGALQTSRLGRWIATAWARGPPALGRFLAALGVGTLIALGPLGLAPATTTGPVADRAATSALRDTGATTLPFAVPATGAPRPTVLWLREGDTLGRIARSLGVGLDELAAANPTLTDLDRVAVGAPIALPETWQGTWNVRRGDTLGAIAGRFGLTPPQVGAQDPGRFGGRSLDLIRTGETLRIGPAPTTPAPATPAPTTPAPTTPGPQQPTTPQPGQPTTTPAPTTPAPTTTAPTTTAPVQAPVPSPGVDAPAAASPWWPWVRGGVAVLGATALGMLGRAALARWRAARTLVGSAPGRLFLTAPPLAPSWRERPLWRVADAKDRQRRAMETYDERTQVVPWLAARLAALEPGWDRGRVHREIAGALGVDTRAVADLLAGTPLTQPTDQELPQQTTSAATLALVTGRAATLRDAVDRATEGLEDAVAGARDAGRGPRAIAAALGLDRARARALLAGLPDVTARQQEALDRLAASPTGVPRPDLAEQERRLQELLDRITALVAANAPAAQVDRVREQVVDQARRLRDARYGTASVGRDGFQRRHGADGPAIPRPATTPMTDVRRRRLAEALAEPATLPEAPRAARELLTLAAAVTRELLDPALGTTARDAWAARFPQGALPVTVTWTTLPVGHAAPSAHTWRGDALEVEVNLGQGPGAAVHEITEALLVRAGYRDVAAHRIATFAERAVPAQVVAPGSWLTLRGRRDVADLREAGRHDELQVMLERHDALRGEIAETGPYGRWSGVPDATAWRRVDAAYAGALATEIRRVRDAERRQGALRRVGRGLLRLTGVPQVSLHRAARAAATRDDVGLADALRVHREALAALGAARVAHARRERWVAALVERLRAAGHADPVGAVATALRLDPTTSRALLVSGHAEPPAFLPIGLSATEVLDVVRRETDRLAGVVDTRTAEARAAEAQLAAARDAFRTVMADPFARGVHRGLTNRSMALWTEPRTSIVVSHLTPFLRVVNRKTLAHRADAVAVLTGRYEPGLAERLDVVDPLLGLVSGAQRVARLATRRSPTPGAATSLAAAFGAVDVTVAPDELADRVAALGVPRRAAQEVGNPRPAYGATWDMHLHHGDYSDPRYTRLTDLLGWLRDAGHTGRVVLSPIPQRGRGLATAGGGFYYANTGELRQGITFGNAMLTMRGKFPDVRLFDAIRALPDDLRWRALPGISGARIDIPGAQGYLTTMLLLNPDLAYVVAETTLAKEAVTRLLGPQAAHVLAPEYVRYVRRLNTALRLLADEVRDPAGQIDIVDLRLHSPELAGLITGTGPREYVEVLVRQAENIRVVLEGLGRTAEADALRMRDADGHLAPTAVAPDPYSPHVSELLAAAERTGQVVILHNDAGEAILEADGKYVAASPDERHLRPLVALLRRYPGAQVSLSHLGVGKWTELTVEHLGVLREVLTQEVHRLERTGLGREAFPRLMFDVSWNDLAQHIERSADVRREVIALVRDFPQHFVYGSDSVKSPSLPNYLRHYYDMAPILADVATDAAGADAVDRLLHRNAEAMVGEAARRGREFAFAELTAPDGFYAQLVDAGVLTPARRAVVDGWLAARAAEGMTAPAGYRPVGPTPDWTPGAGRTALDAYLAQHEQVGNAIAWHNAVDPAVVAGRDTPTLRSTNRRIQRADRDADRADAATRAAEERRLAALPEGPLEAPTRWQRLRGRPGQPRGPPGRALVTTAGGTPYTLEALISAREADAMFAGGPLGAAGRRAQQDMALRQVQASQTRLERSETQIAATRDALRRGARTGRWVLGTVLSAGVGATTWALTAGPLAEPGSLVGATVATTTVGAVLSAVAFVVRGLALTPRTVRTQYVRVLHEAPIERGRLSRPIVERLAAELLGNLASEGRMADDAAAARIVEQRAATIRVETDEFLRILDALVNLPLAREYRDPATGAVLRPAETRADREALAIKDYSTWHDKVTRAAGATASSFTGLRPHSGRVGRTLQTVVAGTFALNLTYHVLAGLAGLTGIATSGVPPDAAGLAVVAGVLTNTVFAVTDVLLGWPAFRTAAAGRAGWDDTNDPRLRRWQNIAGTGFVVGGGALTVQLAAEGNLPVAVAAAGFTGASVLLARHGIAIETWRGRAAAPRRGVTAALVTQTGLVGLGLASLPHPGLAAAGAVVAASVPGLYVARRVWQRLGGRHHPGGGDGPLALPGDGPFPTELVATALRRLGGRDVPVDRRSLTHDARGPPVRTVTAAELVRELGALGVDPGTAQDTVRRLVAFTVRGVVHVTAERAAEVAARLGDPAVAVWWRDVLAHESDHHVTGRARDTHVDHDADAAALAARYRQLFEPAEPEAGGRASQRFAPTGHLVRLAAVPTSRVESAVTGQVIREGVTSALLPLEGPGGLAALAGLDPRPLAAVGCQGLCAIDGFGHRIRELGGPDDVVAFVHDDGWLYLDTRTLAALRGGAAAPATWQGLVDEAQSALAGAPLRAAARLLVPLAGLVRPGARGPAGRARGVDPEAYPVRTHDGGLPIAGPQPDLLTRASPLPRGLAVEGWDDLAPDVRAGLAAAAALLARTGLLDAVRAPVRPAAVAIAVLPEAAFAARWSAQPGTAGVAVPEAFAHLGGGLVLREDSFRLDAADVPGRNARLVEASALLLHELTHAVDDPAHAGRPTEHRAHLAEHHLARAMRGALELAPLRHVRSPDADRRRAVAAGWAEVLRQWSPVRPAPRNYPLPRWYDQWGEARAGHDGPLALPGPVPYPADAVVAALRTLRARAAPLDPAVLPYGARGPPVRVVGAEELHAALVAGGLTPVDAADAVARTVAVTVDGAVHLTRERVAAIAARRGRPGVAAWWRDVLTHEADHHVTGRAHGDHDADATALARRHHALFALDRVGADTGRGDVEDAVRWAAERIADARQRLRTPRGPVGPVVARMTQASAYLAAAVAALRDATAPLALEPGTRTVLAGLLASPLVEELTAATAVLSSVTRAVPSRSAQEWTRALDALGVLARPGADPLVLRRVVRTLTEMLDEPLAPAGDWSAVDAVPEARPWLDGLRPGSSRRDRLALALVVAATGRAPWVADLPRSRRTARSLTELLGVLAGDQAGVRGPLEALLSEAPPPTWHADRRQFLGAWSALVGGLVRLDAAVRVTGAHHRVLAGVGALRTPLRDAPPADRAGLVTAHLRAVQADLVADLGRVHGVDRPLEGVLEPGTELWNAAVVYQGVAHPTFRAMIGAYLAVLAAGGDRAAASAAAWDRWRGAWRDATGADPAVVARDRVPADLATRVGDRDVLVGAAVDPVDILHTRHPNLGGSCLDCVHGSERARAQHGVLEPRWLEVNVWSRGADGGRGTRLAGASALLLDEGVLVLGAPRHSDDAAHGPAVRAWLERWARLLGRDLLTPARAGEWYDPADTALPATGPVVEREVALPASLPGSDELWSDALDGYVRVPTTLDLTLHRWSPAGLRHIELADVDADVVRDGLTGPVLWPSYARAWAAALDHATPLPAAHRALDPLLDLVVRATGEWVAGRVDGPAQVGLLALTDRDVPAVVVHALDAAIVDPATGLVVADAGHRWSDGVLHVWALEPAGVVHEVVEAVVAPGLGYHGDAAHVVATLAERAVPGQGPDARSVLPARLFAEVDAIVDAGRVEVLEGLVADHRDARARVAALLPAGPWRDLAQAYTEALRDEAARAAAAVARPSFTLQMVSAPLPGARLVRAAGRALRLAGLAGGAVTAGAVAAGWPVEPATAAGATTAVVVLARRVRAALTSRRAGGGGRDGPVALPGRRAYPARAMADALARIGDATTPLDPATLPYAPRGPPVRVVGDAVLREALRAGGLSPRAADDAVARTLAFTAGGVVVVPAGRVAALAARHHEPAVAAWWRDLLAHEVEHHVLGRGADHDAHAGALAERYGRLVARARGPPRAWRTSSATPTARHPRRQ